MSNKAKLYEKIISVMNKIGQLQKDGSIKDSNDKLMYKYLSEEQTTGALQKALAEFKLVMFPIKVEEEHFYIETMKYDKVIKAPITKVIVTYKICDAETGEHEEIMSIGYGSDSQDKGSNKAMTGAFKYAQRQTFMISTGDDGDHTSSDDLDKQLASSNPPKPASTGQAGQSNGSLASEGQVKMLYAKHKSTGFTDLKEVCELLQRDITKFAEVPASDVTRLAQWLDKQKGA